jgi:hypothetical protein
MRTVEISHQQGESTAKERRATAGRRAPAEEKSIPYKEHLYGKEYQ